MSHNLAVLPPEEVNPMNPNQMSFEERQKQIEKEKEIEKQQQERAKKSTFGRWTQFNNEHTKEMMWLAIKHPKAHAILYFLVDHMDKYNAVMCSYKVLQEIMEVGKVTISKNIKILKENGFLAILKSGTSNVYAINDKVYWKSWGKNKKYSKFPANIILSLSEQEKAYQVKFEDL